MVPQTRHQKHEQQENTVGVINIKTVKRQTHGVGADICKSRICQKSVIKNKEFLQLNNKDNPLNKWERMSTDISPNNIYKKPERDTQHRY